ncbi:MAG: TfoX/Sxy family protein [Deltaproteobacteria bacterium]|nr:TfoX/Sxy family protein [Deltaproteobacteria bacterium]
MAYKDELAARIRAALGGRAGVEERVMFGGIAFLLDGHMFVGTLTPGFAGIASGGMMVRVGRDTHDAALAEPDVVPMVMGGRTMRGFAAVLPRGCATVAQVKRWIARTTGFVATLPPKDPRAPRKKAPTTIVPPPAKRARPAKPAKATPHVAKTMTKAKTKTKAKASSRSRG